MVTEQAGLLVEAHREQSQSSHQASDLGLDSWGRGLRGSPGPGECCEQTSGDGALRGPQRRAVLSVLGACGLAGLDASGRRAHMHVTGHIIQARWFWRAGTVLSVVVGRTGTHRGWALERTAGSTGPTRSSHAGCGSKKQESPCSSSALDVLGGGQCPLSHPYSVICFSKEPRRQPVWRGAHGAAASG